MGDTLHKMQVIIEATTEPLKKGMENSRREVKKSVEEIQKETEKVKNPFKGMESKALQPVRNTLNKIREMLSRNPVKNFQIKAGIKVPTEEYAELQKNLSKAQQSLEKLQEKQHKFENTGKSKENQQWKSLVVDITRAEKKLSEYKDAAAKMETSGTAFKQTPTDEYREIRNSVKSLNEEIEKYEKKGEKLEAMGVKKESKQWRSLIYDIEQARGKLFEYEEKMKSLEKSGKSTQQVPTEEYQKIQKDILKVNKELDAYREKKNKLQALGVSKESQEWKSLTYDIDQAKIAVEEYKTKARQMESSNTDVKRPVSLPKQALNFGTGIFKGIGATVSKGWGGFTKLLGGVGNVASSFTGVIRKCSGAYAALIQKFTSGIPFLNRTKSSFNGLGTSGRGLTDGSGGDYSDCSSKMTVYLGDTDVSDDSIFTVTVSAGVTGHWDETSRTYYVTAMSADNGYVDIDALYGTGDRYLTTRKGLRLTTRAGKYILVQSGGAHIRKRFSISKAKDGKIGLSYDLHSSTLAVRKQKDGKTLIPASITFSATQNDNGLVRSYSGRYSIQETEDGTNYMLKYVSVADEIQKIYTPSSANIKAVRCTLLSAGGVSELDTQTVIILVDAEGLSDDIKKAQDTADAAKEAIVTTNQNVANIESGMDGFRAELKQTTTDLHGLTDNTLLYNVKYQDNGNDTTTLSAVLYKNGNDVTKLYPARWYTWNRKTESGQSYLGYGYSITVKNSDYEFGGVTIGSFTTYDTMNLTTRSGNQLTTRSGNHLTVWREN